MHFSVTNIRYEFKHKFLHKEFVSTNREASMDVLVGNRTIEIVGASFIADEDVIFGNTNEEYVRREEEWYNSMSLNVNDIPGGTPAIWKSVATKDGFINSNYGYLIYSEENHNQYNSVLQELSKNPESRRAIMIYTRPSIWNEYNKDGMSDFICTNTVQAVIRNNQVHFIVQMRSNDAWAGYRNDVKWAKHVQSKLTNQLNTAQNRNYKVGDVFWQVGSLHLYEKDFYLVDHFAKTGEIHISKKDYELLYK